MHETLTLPREDAVEETPATEGLPQVINIGRGSQPFDAETYSTVLSDTEIEALQRVRPHHESSVRREKGDGPDTEVVKNFIKEAKKFGLLRAEEEVILGTLVHKGRAAADRLAVDDYDAGITRHADQKLAHAGTHAFEIMRSCNLLLTLKPAQYWHHKYKNIGVADFIQVGAFDGLTKAIEKFDPKKGYKFSTYAMWWINNSMKRHGQHRNGMIKMPFEGYVDGSLKKYEDLRREEVSEEEIVKRLELTPRVHEKLKAAYSAQQITSLDVDRQDSSGDSMSFHNVVEDRRAQRPFEEIFTDATDKKTQLGPVYETLLQLFGSASVWALMNRNEGLTLDNTDSARVRRLEVILKHPAAQSVLHETVGLANPWEGVACADDPQKVLRSKEKRIKEMCIACPLLDACEDLVSDIRPKSGMWAGIARTPRSYYSDDSPATIRGVANKPA